MNVTVGSFLLVATGIFALGLLLGTKSTPDPELKALQLEHARLEVEISKRIHAKLADSTNTVVAIQIED